MRLWSIHPKHLDSRGLVALWREGLLARAVLLGRTVGYRHHPQLERFRRLPAPLTGLDAYLHEVWLEASARGYRFDGTKVGAVEAVARIPVHAGQIEYEWQHLLAKLWKRDRSWWRRQKSTQVECHPCFRIVPGGREPWERV